MWSLMWANASRSDVMMMQFQSLRYAQVAAETALGYLPTSSEIAEAVVFFASDMSRPITGQALGVNAGHWLHVDNPAFLLELMSQNLY